MSARQRNTIFISYAHEPGDEEWLDRVLVQLKHCVPADWLELWTDRRIRGGDRWHQEIEQALEHARLAICLVSPEFLASKYIRETELPTLKRRAEAKELEVLCLPISSSLWQRSAAWLGEYQWLRSPDEPLDLLRERGDRNLALTQVLESLLDIVDGIETQAPATPANPVFGSDQAPIAATISGSAERAPASPLATIYGVPELPKHLVRRVDDERRIVRAILEGDHQAVGLAGESQGNRAVGLQGSGGIGKTILAATVVTDEPIRRAFPDGIHWLTLGQEPSIQELQQRLLQELGRGPTQLGGIHEGRRAIQGALRDRAALVVLDDVWQPEHAAAFGTPGPKSRFLLTTRDTQVLTTLGVERESVDVLTEQAALELLSKWSDVPVEALPAQAPEIIEACGRLALAVALAGAQVRDQVRWEDLLHALKSGRLRFLDHPFGSVFNSIQSSVDTLSESEAERYFDLAVILEDARIPEHVVRGLWRERGGLEEFESGQLIARLAGRGLLYLEGGAIDGGDRSIYLHDLQHDFVRLCVRDLAEANRALLRAFLPACDAGRDPAGVARAWSRLAPEEAYLWRNIVTHLRQGQCEDELRALLTSTRWLEAKLRATDLAALWADLGVPDTGPTIAALLRILRTQADWLTKEPASLTSVVVNGLVNLGWTHDRIHGAIDVDPDFNGLRLRFPLQNLDRSELTMGSHDGTVNFFAITPDGRRALSASDDNTLKLWDLETGEMQASLEGHANSVIHCAITPDGKRALSASWDNTLRLWDLETGEMHASLEGHANRVIHCAVTPDGKRALSASWDNTLRLWDLETGEMHASLEGHANRVIHCAVTPDGKRALSASSDNTLRLWDLETGEMHASLEGHANRVIHCAVTPDGKRALSASSDNTLKLWDLETGEMQASLEGHAHGVIHCAITPDGRRALSASSDNTLKLWDLETGEMQASLEGHAHRVIHCAVTPDGKRALSASSDNTLRLWDLETGEMQASLEGHAHGVIHCAITPDGKRALSASRDKTLKLWDLETGEMHASLEGHANRVIHCAVTPDGKRALSASSDNTLKLWDLETGEMQASLEGHAHRVIHCAITPDGKRVLSASWDKTLKLWDLETGEMQASLEGHAHRVIHCAITPDGKRALSASRDKTLKLWDLETGEMQASLEGHADGVNHCAITPDGKRALSASRDKTLKLWDLETGELQASLEGHAHGVSHCAITPDGKRALSASWDNTLKLWDLETGEMQASLEGHADGVNHCAITPDGKRALSASRDKTLKLWDLETGELQASLEGHAHGVSHCAITPDGKRALSASRDKTLRLWDLESEGLTAVVYGGSGFNMSCVRSQFVCAADQRGNIWLLELPR